MAAFGGIDYSKWDKMDYGDSSSDSDEDETKKNVPRVTRLDRPSQVTITGASTDLSNDFGTIEVKQNDGTPPIHNHDKKKIDAKRNEKKHFFPKEDLTRNGSEFVDDATGSQIYWCQDRHEVIISIDCFDYHQQQSFCSRDIRVKVTGALPYKDRFSSVGGRSADGSCGTLLVSVAATNVGAEKGEKEDIVLLEGGFPYCIHLAEGEESVDWEINRFSPAADEGRGEKKLVRVTLRKAAPMEGMTMWWDRPLNHCPTIDVGTIEGREPKGKETFVDAWNEAHKLFKDRVSSRSKHV